MRAVIQRVRWGQVELDGQIVAKISRGLVVLLGIGQDDSEQEANWLVNKIAELRIFGDDTGRFNLNVQDIKGEVLLVSQFTLYADTRRGRRPNFDRAARPEKALALYEYVAEGLRQNGLATQTGRFGQTMQVSLENDGPVTICLEKEASATRKEAP